MESQVDYKIEEYLVDQGTAADLAGLDRSTADNWSRRHGLPSLPDGPGERRRHRRYQFRHIIVIAAAVRLVKLRIPVARALEMSGNAFHAFCVCAPLKIWLDEHGAPTETFDPNDTMTLELPLERTGRRIIAGLSEHMAATTGSRAEADAAREAFLAALAEKRRQ